MHSQRFAHTVASQPASAHQAPQSSQFRAMLPLLPTLPPLSSTRPSQGQNAGQRHGRAEDTRTGRGKGEGEGECARKRAPTPERKCGADGKGRKESVVLWGGSPSVRKSWRAMGGVEEIDFFFVFLFFLVFPFFFVLFVQLCSVFFFVLYFFGTTQYGASCISCRETMDEEKDDFKVYFSGSISELDKGR